MVPIGGPTLEVEIERAPENDVVIMGQGDDYTMDGKWAAPRSASQASCRSGIYVYTYFLYFLRFSIYTVIALS